MKQGIVATLSLQQSLPLQVIERFLLEDVSLCVLKLFVLFWLPDACLGEIGHLALY